MLTASAALVGCRPLHVHSHLERPLASRAAQEAALFDEARTARAEAAHVFANGQTTFLHRIVVCGNKLTKHATCVAYRRQNAQAHQLCMRSALRSHDVRQRLHQACNAVLQRFWRLGTGLKDCKGMFYCT
jgi:hypothetical protein